MKDTAITELVLTFPILSGKVEAWRRFCQELSGSRLNQYEASRQRLGITRERMALIATSFGATAVTTIESLDGTRALGLLISSDRSFDVWYREKLRELHGVNLAGYKQFSQSMPLPRNHEVHFEWELNPNNDGKHSTSTNVKTRKEKEDEHQGI